MRIAYVCMQPRVVGGASDTHVASIVAALRDLGHDVDVIEIRSARSSMSARVTAAAFEQFRQILRIRRADVVWVRMHPMAVLTVAATTSRSSSLVVEVNGVAEDFHVVHPGLRRVRVLLQAALDYQLEKADQVFAVTEGLAAQVRARYPGRSVTVLPNAADPCVFRPDKPRPTDAPARYAIFFGALARWQGVEIAVDAAMRPEWPEGLELLIIGDGPDRKVAQEASAALPTRITYLGVRDPGVLPNYVANAAVSLIPKVYHDRTAGQSPLKLYESLAAGVPVIATPLAGVTDLPSMGDLVQVAQPNGQSFASAVAELISDEEGRVRRGLRGREHILDGHTWGHRAAAVANVLCGKS